VEFLRELNASGTRRVPAEAPEGFVPTKWRGYLDSARASGNASAYRHYWELCTLLALRDGLRTGDVYVPGSRRYSDPAAYLLTPEAWSLQRAQFCQLVGKPANPAHALAGARDELADALGELEEILAAGDGPVRLDEAGDLVISPLTAEDVPTEAVALKAELTEMLPFAPIVSLVIELDRRTGFLDCVTHAGGKQTRTNELKRNLIAVLISHSTNLGLTRMADACGISYDILAWTAEWYVREETLRAANLAIAGYHQRLPLAPVFGTGTLSSSDGQRFPVRGKTLTGRDMIIHGGQVLSTYTHVTDQHTTYGTKIIVATRREAHYVLDEILGNATDIPVTEHATDTHGVTLVNFGLFGLLGLQLSPRIRDLGQITLYRAAPRARVEADYPHTGPLLTRRCNTELIGDHWDDLLRPAGSLKFGHATASLIVGRLSASGRQNALAAALKEYGALRHTIYAARLPVGPGVSAQDLPAAEQGRVAARAQTRSALRPRRHRPRPAPAAADRAGLVSHPGHQRRRGLDDRVQRPGRGLDADCGTEYRRRGPRAHLPGAQRERQLLRLHRGRRRRRAGPARPHRLPAAAGPRHPLLTHRMSAAAAAPFVEAPPGLHRENASSTSRRARGRGRPGRRVRQAAAARRTRMPGLAR